MLGLCAGITPLVFSYSLERQARGHSARGNQSGGNFTEAIKLKAYGKITCHTPPLFPRTFCPRVILRRFTSRGYITHQESWVCGTEHAGHWFFNIYIFHFPFQGSECCTEWSLSLLPLKKKRNIGSLSFFCVLKLFRFCKICDLPLLYEKFTNTLHW